MEVACWSVKGGSGTTVVAAALALTIAQRTSRPVLAVDLAGDLPAVFGLDANGPGLIDWLAAEPDVPSDALARLEVRVSSGVSVLPRGEGILSGQARSHVLAEVLGADPRVVVVDCGVLSGNAVAGTGIASLATSLASAALRSLLVVRPCAIGLRRALECPVQPSGLVVVRERGRALDAVDVSDLLSLPVVADIDCEPAVARAVDAGTLATRLPRNLERSLREAA